MRVRRDMDAVLAARGAKARAEIAARIDAAVEAQARALGYNSAAALAGYAASAVPAWAAEAQSFIAWRDRVWLAAYAFEAEAEATRRVPTAEEAFARLPAWDPPAAARPADPTPDPEETDNG